MPRHPPLAVLLPSCRLSLEGPCRPELHGKGGAAPRHAGFRTGVTRSAPTLRPTGTRTGPRLVVRRKLGRRCWAHRPSGELEDRGRKSRAGRRAGVICFVFERHRPGAPHPSFLEGETERELGATWAGAGRGRKERACNAERIGQTYAGRLGRARAAGPLPAGRLPPTSPLRPAAARPRLGSQVNARRAGFLR